MDEWDHVIHEDDKDEFVIINTNATSPSSVFPPSNHQNLPLPTFELEDSCCDEIQASPPPESADWKWRKCIKMMNTKLIRVAYKVRFYAVYIARLWPVAAVGLVMVVLCRKAKSWQRQESDLDQWMRISRDKDQKISHLLVQIAKMNEILSASQRVAVHRVG